MTLENSSNIANIFISIQCWNTYKKDKLVLTPKLKQPVISPAKWIYSKKQRIAIQDKHALAKVMQIWRNKKEENSFIEEKENLREAVINKEETGSLNSGGFLLADLQ